MRVVDMKDSCSYEYHYDAGNNMVSLRHSAEATFQTNYVYDKDSRERTVTTFGHTRTTHYDKYGRISQQVWDEESDTDGKHKTIYTYMDSGDNRYSLVKRIMAGGKATFYEYDENGNIIQISEGTAGAEGKTSTFKYDKRNQLIREDNHLLNKTFAYAYDLGGNMTRMEEYAFTKADKALPETPVKIIHGTFDSTWKDQLLTWNGVSMTYDAIGNMVKKGNTTYTWTQGRKLSTVNNGKKSQYFYDHTGRRARKTVDGVITDFRMAGELLMSQKAGDVTTYFSYDSAGNLIGMSAGRERYFYTRNAQNDITGLIDENGTSVVQYQYDSWGKLLGITGSLASTIGKRNPFRYRGYYYDDETGMYYIKNRYYAPDIKRFICSDEMVVTKASGDTLHNVNLFLYCDNNPLNRKETDGHLWTTILGAVYGAVKSIGEQMVSEKKKITEFTMSDWIDVGCSAINSAVSTTAIGVVGQVVTNIATGCISSIAAGDSFGEAVYNVGTDAVMTWLGGPGEDYGKRRRKYIYNKARANIMLDSSMDRMEQGLRERKIYIHNVKRDIQVGIESEIISGGVSYATSSLKPKKNTMKTPGGLEYHYVPCHPQIQQRF